MLQCVFFNCTLPKTVWIKQNFILYTVSERKLSLLFYVIIIKSNRNMAFLFFCFKSGKTMKGYFLKMSKSKICFFFLHCYWNQRNQWHLFWKRILLHVFLIFIFLSCCGFFFFFVRAQIRLNVIIHPLDTFLKSWNNTYMYVFPIHIGPAQVIPTW